MLFNIKLVRNIMPQLKSLRDFFYTLIQLEGDLSLSRICHKTTKGTSTGKKKKNARINVQKKLTRK